MRTCPDFFFSGSSPSDFHVMFTQKMTKKKKHYDPSLLQNIYDNAMRWSDEAIELGHYLTHHEVH